MRRLLIALFAAIFVASPSYGQEAPTTTIVIAGQAMIVPTEKSLKADISVCTSLQFAPQEKAARPAELERAKINCRMDARRYVRAWGEVRTALFLYQELPGADQVAAALELERLRKAYAEADRERTMFHAGWIKRGS